MTATSPLRVAIVGTGVIGRTHAAVITAHPDLELVAVIDTVPANLRAIADLVEQELGATRPAGFGSIADAVVGSDFDVIAVCTPSGAHVSVTEQALAAGKHVVIEKPLDVSLDRARRIAVLAEEAASRGIVVTVISQHRFDPASVAVDRAISSGRLGRVASATATVAWWRSQEYYDSGTWRGTWELDGGGALMNQGVHTVDLLLHFLGTPATVFGQTARLVHTGIEVEDLAAAVVRFESGAIATLLATTNANPHVGARIEVHGSKGSAVIMNDELDFFQAEDGAPPDAPRAPAGSSLLDGHTRQYDDLVDAIRTGRGPAVTVADATKALALVRAVYLSNTLGAPVAFADVIAGTFDDIVVHTGDLSADLHNAEPTKGTTEA